MGCTHPRGVHPSNCGEGGEIIVKIYTKHKELSIIINNPYAPENDRHAGNKMALKNIKERLKLHFDLESSIKTNVKNNRYEVHIRIPFGS